MMTPLRLALRRLLCWWRGHTFKLHWKSAAKVAVANRGDWSGYLPSLWADHGHDDQARVLHADGGRVKHERALIATLRRMRPVERSVVERVAHIVGGCSSATQALRHADNYLRDHPAGEVAFFLDEGVWIVRTSPTQEEPTP